VDCYTHHLAYIFIPNKIEIARLEINKTEVNAMDKKKIVIVTPKPEKVEVNVGEADDRTASMLAALVGLILGKKVTVEDKE
jgi:hypothetical protein